MGGDKLLEFSISSIMPFTYRFDNPDGAYFVTFTAVEWIDVFTRSRYSDIVVESLRFCIQKKGLRIHAWVIMSSHLHLIISRNGKPGFSDIIRDFKKFTADQIIAAIQSETESRRNWMIWLFKSAGRKNSNNKEFQFWQQGNHPEELITNKFIDQKLHYIHENPVNAGLVYRAEDYVYSSAIDYAGGKGLLPVVLIE